MKIIICGLGNIGIRVAEQFIRLGERPTVVSDGANEMHERLARSWKCTVVRGDARDGRVLQKAGIRRCDAILSVTGDDEVNLEIAIRAREMNHSVRIVARIFDENFSKKISKGFGIQKALSVSHLAFSSFVSSCMSGATFHTFRFAGAVYNLAVIAIDDGSPLSGMTLAGIQQRYSVVPVMAVSGATSPTNEDHTVGPGDSVIFLADGEGSARLNEMLRGEVIEDIVESGKKSVRGIAAWLGNIPSHVKIVAGAYAALLAAAIPVFSLGLGVSPLDALYFTVTTTTTVGYGDINLQHAGAAVKLFGCAVMLGGAAILASVFSIVTEAIISRRFGLFFGISVRRMHDHVVIAGLGNVGYRVANFLRESGEKIVTVEKDQSSEHLSALRGRIPVIFGSAKQNDVMMRAGIERARTVMALTDDDMVNLNILIDAKLMNPEIRTVGRFFNRDIGSKAVESFGIHCAMSTSYIAAPTFAASVLHPDVEYAFVIDDVMYVLLDTGLGEDGYETARRMMRHGMTVLLGLNERGPVLIRDDTVLSSGDRILSIGHYGMVKKLAGMT